MRLDYQNFVINFSRMKFTLLYRPPYYIISYNESSINTAQNMI